MRSLKLILIALLAFDVVGVVALYAGYLYLNEPAPPEKSAPHTEWKADKAVEARILAGGDAERGEQIYKLNCLACHGPDPSVDGPVGPAIADSPPEVVKLRVLNVTYPEGYTPKRDTVEMIPLPLLADEIHHLATFLSGSK